MNFPGSPGEEARGGRKWIPARMRTARRKRVIKEARIVFKTRSPLQADR
jgi:hypothetical protein